MPDDIVSNRRIRFSLRKLFAFVTVAAIIAGITIRILHNPLRGSDSQIQAWLDTKIPIGTSVSEMQSVAKHEGWNGGEMFVDYAPTGNPIVPRRYFDPELGSYKGETGKVTVFAMLTFDENDKLITIQVHKLAQTEP
jgi:hypothetical protein